MSKERDILKSLLLKEELAVLEQLENKLLSEDRFTDEVAKVLSNAINRSQKKDPQLEYALEKPIKKGVLRAFSESKQSIIDALLPIMGQLIRKTVTNSIRQFVSDINRTIELGFSTKALKWRWQAKKAGVTYPEWIFQKTIRYQVQDIFLINKENGLLIEYAGSDDLLKDSNAISAMLTAIQSFIGDSFESEDAHLQSVEIKNQNFIVATGPKVYLAAVVKGNPTERLRQRFQEIIENIHADYSEVLLQEDTYQNNQQLNEFLKSKLITKSLSDAQEETKILPWIVAFLLIVSAIFYWSYNKKQALNAVIDKSNQIEGFYLQKVEAKKGGYNVYGLLDPLADTDVFNNEKISFITKPYISIDTEIVEKRIRQATSDYNSIKTTFKDGHLELSGVVSPDEQQLLLSKLYGISGVEQISNHLELPSKPKKEIKEDFSPLLKQINQTFINIPDVTKEESIKSQLVFVVKSLQLLQAKQVKMELNITGTSDCFGLSSDSYSLQRAKTVKDILLESKVLEPNNIIVTIKPCKENNRTKDLSQLGVSLKLTEL